MRSRGSILSEECHSGAGAEAVDNGGGGKMGEFESFCVVATRQGGGADERLRQERCEPDMSGLFLRSRTR